MYPKKQERQKQGCHGIKTQWVALEKFVSAESRRPHLNYRPLALIRF